MITAHYGCSPRLTNVILTPPAQTDSTMKMPSPTNARRKRDRFFGRSEGAAEEGVSTLPNRKMPSQSSIQTQDILELAEFENVAASQTGATSPRMNYMNLVQNVWHFHAVEWGGRFTCIGFNHHHKISPATVDQPPPEFEEHEEPDFDTGDYDPEGRRVWSWLILCDDGTVISIHEPLCKITQDDLLIVRRNMITVFRSLSLSPAALDTTRSESSESLGNGLDDLPLRVHQDNFENVYCGPSLLLYYLFDDWHSSYEFVLGRGAPYSTQMRVLRNDMHKDPKLGHLSKLHKISRQLAMLKRMYESKKNILDNILYRQENSNYKQSLSEPYHTADGSAQYVVPMGDPEVLGVPLGHLSVAKFERLRDRIKLYVLGELESLLTEKSELENLTFNLISLKQSATVEVLTRVTIWLTGLAFLFLPLTLLTGFFSMSLVNRRSYTEGNFWGSAGVSVAIATVVLYTVGKSTGTLRLRSMFKAIKRVWIDRWAKRKNKVR